MTSQAEQYTFQAEIRQLLRILIHSLYQEREIFLRELISNASDALNRFQFERVTREEEEIVEAGTPLEIHIEVDAETRTLTVRDNGVGMTRDEMIQNLGTIARSGAAAFLEALESRPQEAGEIIGQFGVGFYSVFMVADRVEVISRSFRPDAEPVRWLSDGSDAYEIGAAEKESRGTEIVLHLKEEAAEFAQAWRVEQVVRRHSSYVSFPIFVGEKRVNLQEALWRRTPREVDEEAYHDFYRQLTLDPQTPLEVIHLSADAPLDLHTILFIPARRERGPLSAGREPGLRLFSRKVLIDEQNRDLLPDYLRFVEGVVDSEDLPLNVSRETVQSNQVMAQIRRSLTGRVQKALQRMATKEPEKYADFWREFGLFLKEGVATEFGASETLAPLLRFYSSESGAGALTSLADYRERMGEDQEAIYYVMGEDLRSVQRSPHLDPFRARGIEVLYLVDPIDSFMIGRLDQFDDLPLRNAGDPDLDLPTSGEETPPDMAAPGGDFDRLKAAVVDQIGERITEVRASTRLTDSPVRLAAGPGAEMDRVRRLMGDQEAYEVPKRALELNRNHPIIRDLATLAASGSQSDLLAAGIEQLYENALLLEGLHPNPAEMVPRLQQLLAWAAAGGASASPPPPAATASTQERPVSDEPEAVEEPNAVDEPETIDEPDPIDEPETVDDPEVVDEAEGMDEQETDGT